MSGASLKNKENLISSYLAVAEEKLWSDRKSGNPCRVNMFVARRWEKRVGRRLVLTLREIYAPAAAAAAVINQSMQHHDHDLSTVVDITELTADCLPK